MKRKPKPTAETTAELDLAHCAHPGCTAPGGPRTLQAAADRASAGWEVDRSAPTSGAYPELCPAHRKTPRPARP